MGSLQEIPVHVEGVTPDDGYTYNVQPVLHQVRHALEKLVASDDPTTIDLSAMPFGPGDEAQLREALGEGEVSASVTAFGETRIRETGYSGVWLVEHISPDETRLALHIEVAQVPLLLTTPKEDIHDAHQRLSARLSG